VTFAVPEEAKPFQRILSAGANVRVLITGVGATRAVAALDAALRDWVPGNVVSSGFAGGLDPTLACGDVLFDASDVPRWEVTLLEARARPARFHTVSRILTTAGEKAAALRATGADAVEMESEAIRGFCRERNLPCGIVRVISDTAREDLPLDFNRFLDDQGTVFHTRLLAEVVRKPRRIAPLLRLRRSTRFAAQALARVLRHLVADPSPCEQPGM